MSGQTMTAEAKQERQIEKDRTVLMRVRTAGPAVLTAQAVGYVRVSTEGQAQEGVSLEAQAARVSAWALAHGRTLAGMHVDAGLSGKRADNRPALQAALMEASRLHCPLVVYSLSRLARSTKDAIAISDSLQKAGADLVSLTESIDTTSATGKLFFTLLAALGQFERDLTSERTSAALQHMKAQGLRVGQVPYGWQVSVDDATRLQPRDDEQATIARVRGLRAEGLSLRAVAARLTAEGVATRTGGAWQAQQIANLEQAPAVERAA